MLEMAALEKYIGVAIFHSIYARNATSGQRVNNFDISLPLMLNTKWLIAHCVNLFV